MKVVIRISGFDCTVTFLDFAHHKAMARNFLLSTVTGTTLDSVISYIQDKLATMYSVDEIIVLFPIGGEAFVRKLKAATIDIPVNLYTSEVII